MSRGHRLDTNLIESWRDFEIDSATIEKYINELNKIGCTSFIVNNKDIKENTMPILNGKKVNEDFSPIQEKNSKEMINHPSHYGGADNPYEAIKVIEAWEADFNIGTALRYLCRCGKKTIGGSAEEMRLEDIQKAIWYLNREVRNIKKDITKSNNPYQE